MPQAEMPLEEDYNSEDIYSQVVLPLNEDYTNYTNNHFATFQEEKEQHQDILQRYNLYTLMKMNPTKSSHILELLFYQSNVFM